MESRMKTTGRCGVVVVCDDLRPLSWSHAREIEPLSGNVAPLSGLTGVSAALFESGQRPW